MSAPVFPSSSGTKSALLPCPFCGSTNVDYVAVRGKGYRIECKGCLARSPWGDYGFQVLASWNKRSSPTPQIAGRVRDKIVGKMRAPAGNWDSIGLSRAERELIVASLRAASKTWDKGEHEGCGIDSQRALDRFNGVAQRPSPRDALAQTLLDEDYQDCDSYGLADAVLKHWDVSWKGASLPAFPAREVVVTPEMVSAGMAEIPEDGAEYEHVEAAYRAMVALAISSTDGKSP